MCKKRLSRGKADPWERLFYDVFWVPSCFEALFKFPKVLLKCFFRRISSRPCYCFAFLDTIYQTFPCGSALGSVRYFSFFFFNNFIYKTISYTTYSINYTYIVLASYTTDTYTYTNYAYTTLRYMYYNTININLIYGWRVYKVLFN